MANGSNDKRSNKTNIPNPSSSSSSQQQSSVTSSTSLVPNNPHRTENPVVQFSGTGTLESFNNHDNGSQDFSNATIESSRTEYSFNNLGPGSQTYKGAEIRRPRAKIIEFKFQPYQKRDRAVAHSGTLNSFNNSGTGSQTFDGFKLN